MAPTPIGNSEFRTQRSVRLQHDLYFHVEYIIFIRHMGVKNLTSVIIKFLYRYCDINILCTYNLLIKKYITISFQSKCLIVSI